MNGTPAQYPKPSASNLSSLAVCYIQKLTWNCKYISKYTKFKFHAQRQELRTIGLGIPVARFIVRVHNFNNVNNKRVMSTSVS